jgi:hypothetical protein
VPGTNGARHFLALFGFLFLRSQGRVKAPRTSRPNTQSWGPVFSSAPIRFSDRTWVAGVLGWPARLGGRRAWVAGALGWPARLGGRRA